MHLALAAIIFIMLIAFAVLFVGGWIVLTVGRVLFRGLGGGARATRSRSATNSVVYCGRKDCNADNPARARFCRRCGAPLQQSGGFGSRRVA
ncbi:MAG TPA: zinc ribbon domain-containing protein [Tepidisphaeraceae bacterium]|nr:zinc ribbon domain-containing protein [Tepidisphaeraceae bacterium]